MRILHLSDLHFGTIYPHVAEACRQTLLELKGDMLIASGDITQRAKTSEFRAAKTFFDSLPIPYKMVITGNHDIPLHRVWERFMKPYHKYEAFFGTRSPLLQTEDVMMIGVDATSRFRHTKGKVSLRGLQNVLQSLPRQQDPHRPLIGVAVHQPLQTAWEKDQEEILLNSQAVADLLTQYKVDFVLSGHVHVPLVCTSEKAFPDLSRNFLIFGAGTATSWRTRTGVPNSFHVIDLERSPEIHITLTRFEYTEGEKVFFPVEKNGFLKQSGIWVTRPLSE